MEWNTVAAIATAIGVCIAAWQFRESVKLTQSTFEDSLDQQYRALIKDIPVDALIGKEVIDSKKDETRELIYNYLDLCNEQIFLRKRNRISKETWLDWCAGMKSNLEKTAFKDVWSEVKMKSNFSFLEELEKTKYNSDPVTWE